MNFIKNLINLKLRLLMEMVLKLQNTLILGIIIGN